MEEKSYHNHKGIIMRKVGRPKGSKNKPKEPETGGPTPTPVQQTEQEQLEEWVKNNRAWFFNYGKKDREDLKKVYRLYNILFNSDRRLGNCGGCHLNIIKVIKRKYYE